MWWKNNKGFFLLELLLSLSAWFMLCLFLLPLLLDLRTQAEQIEISKKAEQLVFEELQAKLAGSQSYSSYSVTYSGIEYNVFWRDSALNGKKEVCVKVEQNLFSSQTERCSFQE